MAQNQDISIDWSTLKGKYFHSFDNDGFVRYQGVIIDHVGAEIIIVQRFEWMAGSPWERKAVWLSEIVNGNWELYGSVESMHEAYEYKYVKRKPSEDL